MEGRGQGLPALSSLKRRSLLFSAAALTNSTDTQTHTTADSPVSLMDKTIFTTKLKCFWVSSHCSSLLPSLLHLHLVTLLTGDRQSNNQRHKLLKVHLAVPVGVQVLHDLVYGGGVLLSLQEVKEGQPTIQPTDSALSSPVSAP